MSYIVPRDLDYIYTNFAFKAWKDIRLMNKHKGSVYWYESSISADHEKVEYPPGLFRIFVEGDETKNGTEPGSNLKVLSHPSVIAKQTICSFFASRGIKLGCWIKQYGMLTQLRRLFAPLDMHQPWRLEFTFKKWLDDDIETKYAGKERNYVADILKDPALRLPEGILAVNIQPEKPQRMTCEGMACKISTSITIDFDPIAISRSCAKKFFDEAGLIVE